VIELRTANSGAALGWRRNNWRMPSANSRMARRHPTRADAAGYLGPKLFHDAVKQRVLVGDVLVQRHASTPCAAASRRLDSPARPCSST
jgi:hypothetical protein